MRFGHVAKSGERFDALLPLNQLGKFPIIQSLRGEQERTLKKKKQ